MKFSEIIKKSIEVFKGLFVILQKFIKAYTGFPKILQKGILIVWMFLLANWFPWGILGELGSYAQAGLILGAIFLIIKLLKDMEKSETSKSKKK